MEESQELLVGRQTPEKRTIEAVHGLAEEPKKRAEKEQNGGGVGEGWLLLQECLIESL